MRFVYIAASMRETERADDAAGRVRAACHAVSSTWHCAGERSFGTDNRLDRQCIAAQNYTDLLIADTLILLAHPDGRGSLVELGYAIARGYRCIVVGGWQDVTLMADQLLVQWVDSVDAAVTALGGT